MKSTGKNYNRRVIKDAVREELLKQVEHYDLCFFKDRYFDKDDERIFGERGDTFEMREKLKKIGFDYDEEVKRNIER